MEYIIVAGLGALIGSFLSVCIYRIPLGRHSGLSDEEDDFKANNSEYFEKRVTIVYPPRSFCPHCGAQIKWFYNIPILGWLLLGGRAACCSEKISIRYPIVEFMSLSFACLSVWTFGLSATAFVVYAYCCALIVLSFIDIDYFLLPNVITYPSFAVGVALAALNQYFHLFEQPLVPDLFGAFMGFMAGAGFLYGVAYLYLFIRRKQGLGLGDVKLLAMTGVFFGWEASIYTIFIGSLLGSIIGIGLMLIGKGNFSKYLPFGPYLAVANILYIFSGNWLMLQITAGIRALAS